MSERSDERFVDDAALAGLRREFRGDLVSTDDAGYEEARHVWNAMIDKRPALIARCAGTPDVIAALRFARERGLEVSVRSGGHSVAGHGVADVAVTIDLSRMRAVRVDPDARRARVDGGCLLSDVDNEAQRFGLATTLGVVSLTGVGGLTLGGGEGWLGRKHGMTCDNLLSAEVVTADGEILVASEDRNPDLFWGLRGGGGNFGIVTSFEFQLHEVGPMVFSVDVLYALDDGMKALHAFRDYVAEAPDEATFQAAVLNARPWPFLDERYHGQPVVLLALLYFGEREVGERIAAPLRQAGQPLAEINDSVTYTALQSASDEGHRQRRRQYWKSNFFWELPDAALETFLTRGAPEDEQPPLLAEFLTLGGAIARVDEKAMAYSHRSAVFDFITTATWDDPAEDDRHIMSARRLGEAMAKFSPGGVYVNNLGAEGQERVRAAYGAEKYERLVALKDRYDPDNVFHLNQNIRPSSSL